MTTDITELALIAKIKKQLENFDTVVLKEAEAKALVEALEKAEAKNAIVAGGIEAVTKLHERIAELEESNAQVIRSRDHYKRMTEEGLKQLAESRTVTVKLASRRLPSDYVDGEFGNDDLAAIHNACRLECKVSIEKYLSAYGIVVKWEGE